MKVIEIPQLLPSGGRLTGYLHEPDDFFIHRGRRPAVVVIPGGGYQKLAERETDPVAFEFFSAGFNTFILRYSIRDENHPEPLGLDPLAQASKALVTIRNNAAEWNTRENQVAVLGFSAGGHLAGCAGTMWNKPEVYRALKKKSPAYRPDGMVLCYPVITSGPYGHRESFLNLLGERCDELADTVSLEKRVTRKTPPAFLWHTADDTLVPVENSLLMVKALEAREVPCELHIYPHGRHGQSLADHTVYAEADMHRLSVSCGVWVERCDAWLRRRFLQKQEVPVNE